MITKKHLNESDWLADFHDNILTKQLNVEI